MDEEQRFVDDITLDEGPSPESVNPRREHPSR